MSARARAPAHLARVVALACAALLTLSQLIACGGRTQALVRTEDFSALYLRGDAGLKGVALTVEGAHPCLPAALAALAPPPSQGEGRGGGALPSLLTALLTSDDLAELPTEESSALVARLAGEGHEVAPRLPWSPALSAPEALTEALSAERESLAATLSARGWRREPLPPVWRPSGDGWRAHLSALSAPHALAALWSRYARAGDAGEWDTSTWRAGDIISLDLSDPPGAQRCAAAKALSGARDALARRGVALLTLSALLRDPLTEALSPSIALSQRPPISDGCARLFGFTDEDVAADRAGGDEGGEARARWSLILGVDPATLSGARARAFLTLPLPAPPALPRRDGASALERLWSQRHLWWGAAACLSRVSEADLLPPLPPTATALTLIEPPRRPGEAPRVTRLEGGWSPPWGRRSVPSHDELLAREEALDLPVELRGLLSELAPRETHLRDLEAREGVASLISAPLSPNATAAEVRAAIAGVLLLSAHPLRPYRALALLSGERRAEALAYAGRVYAGPLLSLSARGAWRGEAQWRGSEAAASRLDPVSLTLSALAAGVSLRAGDLVAHLSPAPPLNPQRAPSVYGGRGGLKASLLSDARAPSPADLWRLSGGERLGEQRLRLLGPAGEGAGEREGVGEARW